MDLQLQQGRRFQHCLAVHRYIDGNLQHVLPLGENSNSITLARGVRLGLSKACRSPALT